MSIKKKEQGSKKTKKGPVILIVLAVLFVAIAAAKGISSRTDADLVLTMSEYGFEGHL